MSLLDAVRLDIRVNKHSKKATVIVVMFRVAHYLKMHRSALVRLSGYPLVKIYQVFILGFFGVYIPCETQIGVGFNLIHGRSVVINGAAVLGNFVLIRQFTTIGSKSGDLNNSPVIGNHVHIGANCVITGGITVGNNVTIGAGSVVTKSIPANSVAYGNPLKIVGKTIIGKINPTNTKKEKFNSHFDELLNTKLYINI